MMEFPRLGMVNAYRNLNRSLITVLAMAMAGLMMTASLSVQQGYGAATSEAYRAFMGGDILIYAENPLLWVADLSEADSSSWAWDRASGDLMGPLAYFHPELRWIGHIKPDRLRPTLGASALDLARLLEQVQAVDGVEGVTPYWTMPVPALHFARWEFNYAVSDHILRSWPLHHPTHAETMTEAMVTGRYFRPEDDGQLVALVDHSRANLSALGIEDVELPGIGEVITLTTPRPWRDELGQMYFDYTQTKQFDLTIIGSYALPSRTVAWTITVGEEEIVLTEQLYFTTPEILVPPATFAAIASQLTGNTGSALGDELTPVALGVTVDNFAFVESIATAIRHQLGNYSVVSVPRQVNLANQANLPEPIFRAPVEDMSPSRQRGYPVDVSPVFNAVLFLVAALIAATNATILVLERRKEIGILKAVGATDGSVVIMVLSEVLALSLLGAVSGFLVVRVYATSVLLSTQTPWLTILHITAQEGALVVAATGIAATAFALLPALGTVRLSALEVLKE